MIEADFHREYKIDLVKELPFMTWRKFNVLLGGLSGDSVLISHLRNHKEVLQGAEGEKAVDKVWG